MLITTGIICLTEEQYSFYMFKVNQNADDNFLRMYWMHWHFLTLHTQ